MFVILYIFILFASRLINNLVRRYIKLFLFFVIVTIILGTYTQTYRKFKIYPADLPQQQNVYYFYYFLLLLLFVIKLL